MNKTELVTAIAEKTGLTKKASGEVLVAFTETITEALQAGDKVQLVGFGTFESRERGERTCRNPQTGDQMTVAACKVPKFKAGKSLKEIVNQ